MNQTRSALSASRIKATAAALARSANHIARDRVQRSSSTPAQGPTSNAGKASNARVSPIAAADPVRWKTWNGIATTNIQEPTPEMTLLAQSSRKLLFLRTEVCTAWKLSSQNISWQECRVAIDCRYG